MAFRAPTFPKGKIPFITIRVKIAHNNRYIDFTAGSFGRDWSYRVDYDSFGNGTSERRATNVARALDFREKRSAAVDRRGRAGRNLNVEYRARELVMKSYIAVKYIKFSTSDPRTCSQPRGKICYRRRYKCLRESTPFRGIAFSAAFVGSSWLEVRLTRIFGRDECRGDLFASRRCSCKTYANMRESTLYFTAEVESVAFTSRYWVSRKSNNE